ncbi:SusC/RagA family TonB-linked outer membrane protein [Parafilimonas sp.]|uniref:SusC/RagA family TonB-linked outer membrane protein n=1 Tax=Parafilimonas sp. TaxID=1969739 RepID=UPI0039E56E9A
MLRKTKSYLLSAVIMVFTVLARGQETKPAVTGLVRSSSGEPVQGTEVSAVNATKTIATTLTDSLGRFRFEKLPEGNINFKFSNVGYVPQTVTGYSIKAGQTTSILVDLVPDQGSLDDVVVVGYGSVKKKNVTGSIVSVKASELNVTASTNVAQALAGRAAGVSVIQSSGQPGADVSVTVRANPSDASPGVLYVVDGVIINDNSGEASASTRYGSSGISRSALNFINPNDIESIEFLKDASATAIYGARAGGGVMLITTKKGKAGKPSVAYDGSYSIQKAFNFYDILGTKDYMEQRNLILYENYLYTNDLAPYGTADASTVSSFSPKYSDEEIAEQEVMPNALDAITRTGSTEQHNISVSGLSNKTKYFASFNYMDQAGVLIHSTYRRYNGRLNLEQGISEKITIGANVIVSGAKANNANVGTSANEYAGMITSAFYYPATMALIDSNGDYPINPDYQNAPNPLSFREITDYTINSRILASGFAEWKIIPHLTAKASYSWDQSFSTRYSYLPTSFLYGERSNGQASINEDKARSKLSEFTLNYDRSFNEWGHLSFVAGHSYQVSDWYGTSMYNEDFPTDNFTFNSMGLGEADRPDVDSYREPSRIWKSYFARAIYDFRNKYVLSASIRTDGASHFAENKKWGTFPGVSFGWIMSRENFIKDISPINFLKLRLGYGTTGNSDIGSSAFAYYGSTTSNSYVFGNAQTSGVSLTQLANDNLTWETQADINMGVDFQLLKNRVSGSFDYSFRTISNLLSSVSLATSFPVSSVYTNAGKTRARGWDASLTTNNFQSKKPQGFNWSTTFNASHYYSYWIKRSAEALKTLAAYVDPKGPYYGLYYYQSDGIIQEGEDVEAMPGALPGGIKIKDINGYDSDGNLTGSPDGEISSADLKLTANNGTRYINRYPI